VVAQLFANTENESVIAKFAMVQDCANQHFVKYKQAQKLAKNMKGIA